MVFNLRLPEALDVKARAVSSQRYQSLNTLICLALEQYLQDAPVAPVETPKRVQASSLPATPPLMPSKPSKAERQLYTQQARERRKLGF